MKRTFDKASWLALLLAAAVAGCKSSSSDRPSGHVHFFYCHHCGFHHPHDHFHYHYYYYDRRPAPPPRTEVNPAPLPEPPALPQPRPPRPSRLLKQPGLPL